MGLQEFFHEYFVKPQLQQAPPYNPYNTTAFALIALVAAYAIFKGLRKLRLSVNEEFAKAVLPFVFFGAAARVLVDAGILPRKVVAAGFELHPLFYPFVTPGIYVLTFALLALAYALARASGRQPVQFVSRTGFALAALALLPLIAQPWFFSNTTHFIAILALAGLGYGAFEVLARARLVKRGLFNSLAVAGQALDGSATFVGVSFLGYSEQHVLANAIFALGSPFLFYLVKIGFALAVAYFASQEQESEEKNYVLLLIAILGLAPGARDALRILVGV